LLELEQGAELHEIEVAVKGDLAPSKVEVFVNKVRFPQEDFDSVGILEFAAEDSSARVPTAQKRRLKMMSLTAGQVKIVVHEPASGPTRNAFKQVAIHAVELWGCLDEASHDTNNTTTNNNSDNDNNNNNSSNQSKKSETPEGGQILEADPAGAGGSVADPLMGGLSGELAQVLSELGISLDCAPIDEEEIKFAQTDEESRSLLKEMQRIRDALTEAAKLAEAQQIAESMEEVMTLGLELQRLRLEADRLGEAVHLEEAQAQSAAISGLEEKRMNIAAFYDTEWWLERIIPPT